MMVKNYVHERYLDPEERFEIFTVKAAERPHLLRWTPAESHESETASIAGTNEEKKIDSCSDNNGFDDSEALQLPPPLTDGCDLPGWRCAGIAPSMNSSLCDNKGEIDVDYPFQGSLNVGAASTLFRRETMFPFICSSAVSKEFCDGITSVHGGSCWWYSAKQQFHTPPPLERAAPVVQHEDVALLVEYNPQTSSELKADHNKTRKVTIFSLEYEMKNRPVKILGATNGWEAMPKYEDGSEPRRQVIDGSDPEKSSGWMDNGEFSVLFSGEGSGGWTFANLVSRFGDVMFRFSDQHGEMMSLGTYAKYIINPEGLSDDSPLGIYDSEFGDDEVTSVLLSEYSVPTCFSQDLFELVDLGENGPTEMSEQEQVKIPRPPYRWILIGPERSGTGMHVDPLWTNAWVTVLQGLKRWLLFPPDTPHDMIGMSQDKPQIPSSVWFHDFYDKVTSSSWPKCYQPVEVLQHAGETVFVPAGWPHLVLNLALTVAVTHNYASEFGPFSRMCEEVSVEEPEFAVRWYSGLRKHGRDDLTLFARQKNLIL
ncbi:hypothetical protein HJC23_009858 [Cyclotella cryptica]|uniref:JmjC domain-containing protein n=1 Tax=Cyclotella cryptica TaxID=29204 RepID=A0ABD3QBP9_9STRA|eukprot:CCRYP_006973-RA/>CCRYP_006973-RA protein AED:0.02 eAED:0.02 QI:108/1/1/1/0.33/0.25/4/3000/538